MREFYKPKHFIVQELVDKPTFEKYGDSALMFFDVRLLKTIDGIREYFNKPVIINTWYFGGSYKSRGLRTREDTIGATDSFHRKGKAVDFSIPGMTADEIRNIIIKYQDQPPFNDITGMEINVTWVHIDFRNVDSKRIILFKG